jgi:hypothetical protein
VFGDIQVGDDALVSVSAGSSAKAALQEEQSDWRGVAYNSSACLVVNNLLMVVVGLARPLPSTSFTLEAALLFQYVELSNNVVSGGCLPFRRREIAEVPRDA